MLGKDVTDPETLKGALKELSDEIEPNSPPVAASTKYRKNLALNLFYKVSNFILNLMMIVLIFHHLFSFI